MTVRWVALAAVLALAAPPLRAEPGESDAVAPEETLARALDEAYRTAPQLQAQRYTLRATDEDYAQALAETRLTSELQVSGSYDKTVPGRTTQATRFLATSPIETSNTLAATATATQPILTGGKASADRVAALAGIRAGRAQLRSVEGDLLLQVITSYADIRRDSEAMKLRDANLAQLRRTLDEVDARREAGQLTRTDVGLARQQLWLAQSLQATLEQQLESERETFAQLVGHAPGRLAPLPALPGLPGTIAEAMHFADDLSPDLAQAIAAEAQARAGIASAAAAGRPTLSLSGSATLTGRAAPYHLRNEDQQFAGQLVLTIPLINGGRVGSAVAQAQDRDSAARLSIEYTRRQVVEQVVNAWNAMATAQRVIAIQTQQVEAARVYDEGTFAEYHEGLRSTFDVLYAHGVLRDAEISRLSAVRDLYIAQATLLRYIGLLDVRALLTGGGLYDPQIAFDEARKRARVPLDAIIPGADHLILPASRQPGLRQPASGVELPALAPAKPLPDAPLPLVRGVPANPIPGTTGTPAPSAGGAPQ